MKLTVGASVISSIVCFSTLLYRVTVSRAQPLFALVTSCLMAVKKPVNMTQEKQHENKRSPSSLLAQLSVWLTANPNAISSQSLLSVLYLVG